MPKYKIFSVETILEEWVIEADSEEEAEEKFLEGDRPAEFVKSFEGDLWVDRVEGME